MAETATRLVGRTEELALLERALAEAEAGGAVVLEISGDPGIGKTRLLAELGSRGEARHWLVLAGRASELETDLPYWIFVDALDEYLHTIDRRWLDELDGSSGDELGRVFPSLAASHATATVLDERYRVHHAVRELLERLASAKPLVLLLDDLHWADSASVDLLGGLLHRPPNAPVLLGLALRAAQGPSRLVTAIERARRHGLVHAVELRPLREAEAEELLGPELAPERRRILYEESGGNPFYLEQLARTTRAPEAGAGRAAALGSAGVPPAVAAALTEELAAVSTEARTLLEGGAVVGDPFVLDFASAAAGMPEADALRALDELLRPGLLQPTEAPRRFRFRHPLLRSAVYEAIPAGRRSEAHERAARALARHGEPAVVRANHVAQFAPLGNRDAIAVLREAADSSAQRAPASAARWYRAALSLLPAGDEDRDERIELLRRLAEVLAGEGRFAECHAVLEELLALVPADAPTRTQIVAACAAVEHQLGRHEEAHARLVAALERVPDEDSRQAALLMLDLGMDAFYGRDYGRMREWGLRAHGAAEALTDPRLRAAASAMVSVACAFTGRIDEARTYRDESAAIIDALADEELGYWLEWVANLGNAEMYLDRFEDAVRHLDRGLAVGRSSGQGRLFPLLEQRKGFALALLGRLNEAVEVLDRAVEAARLSGSPQSVAWALLNRSWAALMSGDLETALEAAEESVELGHRLDDNPVLTWSACALGSALLEAGEPVRCLETLAPAGGGLDLPRIPGVLRSLFQERIVLALLALGRDDEAADVVSAAEALADGLGLGLSVAMARRARAAVALAAGDTETAVAAALEAAEAADAIGARLEAARSRTLAGRALADAGDRERAATELERAAETLDACGAIRYRDEAERELRRLGRRDHRRRGTSRTDGEGLAALTARELEIARLVVDRRTNPEIAAELFLSQKTVETHLRNAFRKLDVSSRVELARAVERADREG